MKARKHDAYDSSRVTKFSPVPFLLATATTALLTALLVAGSNGFFVPTPPLLAGYSIGILVITMLIIRRYRGSPIPLGWILVSALILRFVCLAGQPLFEDDYHRYLWDGMQTATTNDPYSNPPSAFFGVPTAPGWEETLSRINYPDISTVYGPVLQWIFAASYAIAPGEVWPLQVMAAVADIALLLVLGTRVVTVSSRSTLLLYAWSPLLLKEFAISAHPDIFAVLLVVLALQFGKARRFAIAGLLLGLAVGIKVFAILALPFIAPFLGQLRRFLMDNLRLLSGFLVAVAAITLLFSNLLIWFPEGLMAMADSWLFNAPLYLLLLPTMGFGTSKLVLSCMFVVAAGYLLSRYHRAAVKDPFPCLAALYGLFLLAIPVLNPWYGIWFMAFAISSSWCWPWIAGVALTLSYWAGIGAGVGGETLYRLPNSLLAIEFGIIAAAIAVDVINSVRGKGDTAC